MSLVFHSVMIVLTAISLPFMMRDPVDLPPILSVDLIQITDKTSIPFAAKAAKTLEKIKKEEEKRLVSQQAPPAEKFHHSKLNFKWSGGGEEVRWHQDIGFWPHTNFTPCTVGLYLQDCNDDQGPLGVVAESHQGPLFDQYDEEGNWRGCLSDDDTKRLNTSKIVYLPAPSGSITIHNCRTVHGSRRNVSESPRPLLLNAYSAADAMPYTAVPTPSKYYQKVVRGSGSRWARHEPGQCLIPPDWSGGYRSIFALQQQENLDG